MASLMQSDSDLKTPLIVNASHISDMPQRQKYSIDISVFSESKRTGLGISDFHPFQPIRKQLLNKKPWNLFLSSPFSCGRASANKTEFICIAFVTLLDPRVLQKPNKRHQTKILNARTTGRIEAATTDIRAYSEMLRCPFHCQTPRE